MDLTRYTKDDQHVYYDEKPLWDKNNEPIKNIDPTSFIILEERFGKDKNRVYVQAQQGSDRVWKYFYVIENADPDTFNVLNQRYAKDKNQAYYVTEKTIRTKSPEEFQIIIYRYISFGWDPLHKQLHEGTYNSMYAKDKEHVYLAGTKIKDADPDTFKIILRDYCKDKDHVFYGNKILTDADPNTFIAAIDHEVYQGAACDKNRPYWWGKEESISKVFEKWRNYFEAHSELKNYWWHAEEKRINDPTPLKELGNGFATDGIKVYFKDISLDSVDAGTFKNLGDSFVADKNGLYSFASYHTGFLDGYKIKEGDPGTLRALSHNYFVDKNNAYQINWRGYANYAKVDSATFEVLNTNFCKDKNHLYYNLKRKKGFDPQNARILNENYITDGRQIFFLDYLIKEAVNPETCTAIHSDFLRDGKNLFFKHLKRNKKIHVESLVFLNFYFAKDKKRIYNYIEGFGLFELPDADYDSFEIVNDEEAKDKNNRYNAKELIQKYMDRF
jgi:DKNYY family